MENTKSAGAGRKPIELPPLDNLKAKYKVKEGGLYHRTGPRKGKRAGCQQSTGYRQVRYENRAYLEHRLMWLMESGEEPPVNIDHINGDRSDNRIENLRPADRYTNQFNRKTKGSSGTGIKGLFRNRNCWHCRIRCRGERHCKYFPLDQKEEAVIWLRETREELHGEYHNHG